MTVIEVSELELCRKKKKIKKQGFKINAFSAFADEISGKSISTTRLGRRLLMCHDGALTRLEE